MLEEIRDEFASPVFNIENADVKVDLYSHIREMINEGLEHSKSDWKCQGISGDTDNIAFSFKFNDGVDIDYDQFMIPASDIFIEDGETNEMVVIPADVIVTLSDNIKDCVENDDIGLNSVELDRRDDLSNDLFKIARQEIIEKTHGLEA